MVNVKICGIRRVEDAVACREAGADLAGLNFIATSRRAVDLGEVRAIMGALGPVLPVGLFQNVAVRRVEEVVDEFGLGWIQLHGRESIDDFAALAGRVRILKAYPADFDAVEFADWSTLGAVPLFDGPRPGTGTAFAWSEFAAPEGPFYIAGGLNPDNVAEAIRATGATGVDAASGVERDGSIDAEALLRFVRRARETQESNS